MLQPQRKPQAIDASKPGQLVARDFGVIDGVKVVTFYCKYCSHSTGWIPNTFSVQKSREGIRCPSCNS